MKQLQQGDKTSDISASIQLNCYGKLINMLQGAILIPCQTIRLCSCQRSLLTLTNNCGQSTDSKCHMHIEAANVSLSIYNTVNSCSTDHSRSACAGQDYMRGIVPMYMCWLSNLLTFWYQYTQTHMMAAQDAALHVTHPAARSKISDSDPRAFRDFFFCASQALVLLWPLTLWHGPLSVLNLLGSWHAGHKLGLRRASCGQLGRAPPHAVLHVVGPEGPCLL